MQILRAAVTALGALILASCGQGAPGRQLPEDAPEGVIELSDAFSSEFNLVDQNGRAISDRDFRGKIMIVYFGYTNCPDVCPVDVGTLSAALNGLGKDAGEVAPIFITVDPERDDPETLKAYLSFDERLIGLTGTPEVAAAARTAYKLYARKQPQPDSALGYTVDHGRFFYVIDRSGRPDYAILGGAGAEDIAALLRRSIKG